MKVTNGTCEICGIPCFWNAFDLAWIHMGWTINANEQPNPHRPVVAEHVPDPEDLLAPSTHTEESGG